MINFIPQYRISTWSIQIGRANMSLYLQSTDIYQHCTHSCFPVWPTSYNWPVAVGSKINKNKKSKRASAQLFINIYLVLSSYNE